MPPTFAAARMTTSGLFSLNQFSTWFESNKSKSLLLGQSRLLYPLLFKAFLWRFLPFQYAQQ